MSDKEMTRQQRRMMRHEKEQERKLKKADEMYEKAIKEANKAGELYGFSSEAYKKAKEKQTNAFDNFQIAKGDIGHSKKTRAKRAATPAGKMRARQQKEYMTEKDVDVGVKDYHPGTTRKKASGGSVKKNYAYGGRVAKYSMERS